MRKLNFNVRGEERKRLVYTIAEAIGKPPVYLGAPSFAYRIGDWECMVGFIIVSREGEMVWYESFDPLVLPRIMGALVEAGFFGIKIETLDEDGQWRINPVIKGTIP